MTRDELHAAIEAWGNEEEGRMAFCLFGGEESYASGIKGNMLKLATMLANHAALDAEILGLLEVALTLAKARGLHGLHALRAQTNKQTNN